MNPGDQAFDDAASAFAQTAIGGGLAPEVDALIVEAGRLREQPEQALDLLLRARAAAPRHPVPLIALYRFHFYGHRLLQARAVGEDALAIARTALGPDFGDQPLDRDATRYDAAVRFYLFTLKGLAYLNLRLGELDEARDLLRELRRLDPEDQVGGALLQQVLAHHERHLEADDDIGTQAAYPPRGWTEARP